MSFAKVVISGEISSDPEKRFTPNNHPVTTFNLTVENASVGNRPAEPFTVRVTCWRNLADAASNQLQKGGYVLVEGKLTLNSYQAQDGTQKKSFEVEANSLDKLPGAPEAITPVGTTAQQGNGSESASATKPYGSNASSSYAPADNGNNAAPMPVAANTGGGHFSSEDLLSEDDIPF